jgi:hypothetical protein
VLVVQGHRVLRCRAEVPGRVATPVIPERAKGLLQLRHVRPALTGSDVPPCGHPAGQHEQRLAVYRSQLFAIGDRLTGRDAQPRYVHHPRRASTGGRTTACRRATAGSRTTAGRRAARGGSGPRIRFWSRRVHVVLRCRVHHATHLHRRGKDPGDNLRRGRRPRRSRRARRMSCGDFTNEAPISPPMASRAAAPPTRNKMRRRRASRDPRTACRPPSPGLLSVVGEPTCATPHSYVPLAMSSFQPELAGQKESKPSARSRGNTRPQSRPACISRGTGLATDTLVWLINEHEEASGAGPIRRVLTLHGTPIAPGTCYAASPCTYSAKTWGYVWWV